MGFDVTKIMFGNSGKTKISRGNERIKEIQEKLKSSETDEETRVQLQKEFDSLKAAIVTEETQLKKQSVFDFAAQNKEKEQKPI